MVGDNILFGNADIWWRGTVLVTVTIKVNDLNTSSIFTTSQTAAHCSGAGPTPRSRKVSYFFLYVTIVFARKRTEPLNLYKSNSVIRLLSSSRKIFSLHNRHTNNSSKKIDKNWDIIKSALLLGRMNYYTNYTNGSSVNKCLMASNKILSIPCKRGNITQCNNYDAVALLSTN